MNLKNFFSGTKSISAHELKALTESKKPSDFQLVDVRQPKEYQAGHLAGSQLIPLKELPSRVNELSKERPVIVYCAIGGRSRAAAQLLVGMNFQKVFNMNGGIKAWEGHKAFEQEEYGLELLVGSENFLDSVRLAYKMEDGLQKFYQALADRASDNQQKNLYVRLSLFEEKHKIKLKQECQDLCKENDLQEGAGLDSSMEGGYKISELIDRTEAVNRTQIDIVETAMILETQAMDLYIRMARKSEGSMRKLFFNLADEENVHLSYLTDEFEKLI